MMAWRQINSRIAVAGVAVVDFDSLGDWAELWLEIVGLKHGDAATIEFGVQAGANGTLLTSTSDYSRGGAVGGTAYLEFCTSVPTTTLITADLFFFNFNKLVFKTVNINGGRKNATAGASNAAGVIESVLALNQLRILNSTGVNFTGGDIRLYASM